MYVEEKKKEKSYAGTTKLVLIIRLCVVAYIVYLSVTLLQNYMEGEGLPLYVLIIALTIFLGVGTVVTIISVRALFKGEYAGGKADTKYQTDEDNMHGMKEPDDSSEMRSDMKGDTELLSDRLKKYNEKSNHNDS